MAKRQTKREKRSAEIAEIARQLMAYMPARQLLYVQDVMVRAQTALEDAMRSMTHEEFDRIAEGEEDAFIAAYVRAAMERSASEYEAHRGREEAVCAMLSAERDREKARQAARAPRAA